MSQSATLRFWRAWAANPSKVGAIAPSSAALARRMVAGLNLNSGQTVIEFGPGTGPFTDQIAALLPDPGGYLGIEREAAFVSLLRQRHPQLRFVQGSAEHADRYHAQGGGRPVAAVICGLPFASLPLPVQDGVIRCLDKLMEPGCEFRTFQYVHAYLLPMAVRFRRRMTALFGPGRRSTAVWSNLPPAFVLTWRRGA